jgi:hypothetical protein
MLLAFDGNAYVTLGNCKIFNGNLGGRTAKHGIE